jgi:excisionase family DNA binding protein
MVVRLPAAPVKEPKTGWSPHSLRVVRRVGLSRGEGRCSDCSNSKCAIGFLDLYPASHVLLKVTMKTDRPKSPPKFFTIAQIAEFVEVSTRTVRRWIAEGLLVAHRINGLVRISEADFQAFLVAHRDR